MSRRTDIYHGRQGGHWLPDGYVPESVNKAPRCVICGAPMTTYKNRDRHFTCDDESMVGERCTCPEGCTVDLVGDGGTCDPDCVPCRLNRNRRHRDVIEWQRSK